MDRVFDMKQCPKCHMFTYAVVLSETGKIHHYCQNFFCENLGKNIDDL